MNSRQKCMLRSLFAAWQALTSESLIAALHSIKKVSNCIAVSEIKRILGNGRKSTLACPSA